MTLCNVVRDLMERFGNLSSRKIPNVQGPLGNHRGKPSDERQESLVDIQHSSWASFPPQFLEDVLKRLKQDESNWTSRKDLVACASVCASWRDMCKDIVRNPEFCGKLTFFPVSLKKPGPRDGFIQCFIKRDKSKMTYHLHLSFQNAAVLHDNGIFLLSAKRSRRMIYTDYAISMDKNISRSCSGRYIGMLRSNIFHTKFIIYDTQPPYNARAFCSQEQNSLRLSSRKSYPIAQVKYESNVLVTLVTRQMQCTMLSIPSSAVVPNGIVPGQPKEPLPQLFEESCRFSEFGLQDGDAGDKETPLVLVNKAPRWHKQLPGRVTVASVKNFQLIAALAPPVIGAAASELPSKPHPANLSSSSDPESVILQLGRVSKDTFTMDYRYPLSAFQAFAICLSSFDTQVSVEG